MQLYLLTLLITLETLNKDFGTQHGPQNEYICSFKLGI